MVMPTRKKDEKSGKSGPIGADDDGPCCGWRSRCSAATIAVKPRADSSAVH